MATRHAIGAGLAAALAAAPHRDDAALGDRRRCSASRVGWWALRSLTVLQARSVAARLRDRARSGERRDHVRRSRSASGCSSVWCRSCGSCGSTSTRTLREEGRSGTSSRGTNLLRRGLATAQVAIAFVLLIGAGLLFASFRAVLKLDTGFRSARRRHGVDLAAVGHVQGRCGSRRLHDARAGGASARCPASRAPGLTSSGAVQRRPQRQRDPGRGLPMKPGESLISPVQTLRHRRLLRGDEDSARPRPLLRRARHGELAARRSSSTNGSRRSSGPVRIRSAVACICPRARRTCSQVTPDTKFLTVVGVVKEVQMGDPTAETQARRRVLHSARADSGACGTSSRSGPANRLRRDRSARCARPSRPSIRSCRSIRSTRWRRGWTTVSSAGACRCSWRWRSRSSRCSSRRSGSTACSPTASRSGGARIGIRMALGSSARRGLRPRARRRRAHRGRRPRRRPGESRTSSAGRCKHSSTRCSRPIRPSSGW